MLVRIGHNDTARWESERTKKDFNELFSLLKSCLGKSLFSLFLFYFFFIVISGPLPMLSHDSERISRLLSINT